MSDEEKKAIERTQEHLTEMLKKYEMYNDQLEVRGHYRNGDIKIILNLIEKQQKELEQEKEKNKELEIKASELNGLAEVVERDYIHKDKIKELLENEIIDISGFRCIAVEDIEELLEEK